MSKFLKEGKGQRHYIAKQYGKSYKFIDVNLKNTQINVN